MPRVLLAWVGSKDLEGTGSDDPSKGGPILRALQERKFDHVVLLNDFKERGQAYEKWLVKTTGAEVVLRPETLSSPTAYSEIHRAVNEAVAWTLEKYGPKTTLTFHLSPGTSAMASIWIILAKTRYEAELIESSPQKGVSTVDVPFELKAEFIPAAVQQANEDLARLAEGHRPDDPQFGDIHHRSAVMRTLVFEARQASAFSEPVLILGESGTGKQLLAEAMHREGPRQGKPLEEVNCGSIPRELFESEFFGHAKNAFTGATKARVGYFQRADGGTLFLDEVGELSPDNQVRLLRALQQKKVRPVGGDKDVPVDVRVIAATNRDLLKGVQEGWFREDLYYRLAVIVLRTPPLREREGDRSHLIKKLLERVNTEHSTRPSAVEKRLSVGAENLLVQYDWPGNVRELDNALRRACIFSKGATITEAEARRALVGAPSRAARDVLGRPLGEGFDLNALIGEVAKHYLDRAVAESGNNNTQAAKLIGFASYQRLKDWRKKYGGEK